MKLKSFLNFRAYAEEAGIEIDYCSVYLDGKIRELGLKEMGENADKHVRIFKIEIERPNEKVAVRFQVCIKEEFEYTVIVAVWDFESAASVVSLFANYMSVRAF